MTIEEQIRHYRKQAGLSQEKMAEMIGVSRQAVTKWENGTGIPDISNLMAVADLFKISVDELLSNNTAEKKQDAFLYESATEYDIDGKKNFDLKLGGAREVQLKAYDGEKLVVSLLSNVINDLSSNYKIKIDDIKNRIDVDINRLNGATESEAKEELTIRILVPHKYTGRLELSVNAGKSEDLLRFRYFPAIRSKASTHFCTVPGERIKPLTGPSETAISPQISFFSLIKDYLWYDIINRISFCPLLDQTLF